MRKVIAAAAAGMILIAGQAVAAGGSDASLRVGDRVGAQAGETDSLEGMPMSLMMIGGTIALFFLIESTFDDSLSD